MLRRSATSRQAQDGRALAELDGLLHGGDAELAAACRQMLEARLGLPATAAAAREGPRSPTRPLSPEFVGAAGPLQRWFSSPGGGVGGGWEAAAAGEEEKTAAAGPVSPSSPAAAALGPPPLAVFAAELHRLCEASNDGHGSVHSPASASR